LFFQDADFAAEFTIVGCSRRGRVSGAAKTQMSVGSG
jgi:hypothetical protein